MTPARKPVKVGSILKELLNNLGIDKRIEEYEAFFDWKKTVGEKIASVSRAKSVRDGILIVEVKGSVWMSEISMVKHEVLVKLNKGKNRGKIRDIILVQWRGSDDKN